jgi:hypothetical protein
MDKQVGAFRRVRDAFVVPRITGQHDLLAVVLDDVAECRLDLFAVVHFDRGHLHAAVLVDNARLDVRRRERDARRRKMLVVLADADVG